MTEPLMSGDRETVHLFSVALPDDDLWDFITPDPDTGDWTAWQALMGDTGDAGGFEEGIDFGRNAMAFTTEATGPDGGFATVSSSLIALPDPTRAKGPEPIKPKWLFAPGRPDQTPYEAIEI